MGVFYFNKGYLEHLREEERITMKQIIDQIMQIDTAAYKNEQKNKTILGHQKNIFDNEIRRYRDQKLKEANDKANSIYNEIMKKARTEYNRQEQEMETKSEKMVKRYQQVESDVIEKIFNRIFLKEGKA